MAKSIYRSRFRRRARTVRPASTRSSPHRPLALCQADGRRRPRAPRRAKLAWSRAAPQARVGDLVEPDGQEKETEEYHQDDGGRRRPPPPPAIDHRGVEIDPI